MEVSEQRIRFVVEASLSGRSMTELCASFGISRPTGYLWLERYRAGGVAGMQEGSRRPRFSPSRTAPPIEQRIVQLRRQRPDWGARRLGGAAHDRASRPVAARPGAGRRSPAAGHPAL